MRKQPLKTDRRKARGWLVENGVRQKEIQTALEQKSPTQVHETLQGLRHDRRVLQYILDKGCPAGFLALPEDMLNAA